MPHNSEYLHEVYEPKRFATVVEATAAAVERFWLQRLHDTGEAFDCIAFRGSSGAAMAFPVAARLGLSMMHVRKADDSHFDATYVPVEGVIGAKSYIIIDDFMSSGRTLKTIRDKIALSHQKRKETYGDVDKVPQLVGAFFYTTNLLDQKEYERALNRTREVLDIMDLDVFFTRPTYPGESRQWRPAVQDILSAR